MNIVITARKTTLKDSFKEKVEKKLSKFDRFFDREADANVVVTNEKNRETVEVSITYRGMMYRSEKTTGDRLDSLDAVCDALFAQIVKNKSKLEKRVRQAAFDDMSAVMTEASSDVEFEEEAFDLVRNKEFVVRPMVVEEAILQMNLLGHSFFMFENGDTGEMNVVYRRNDGGYGLLSPIRG